MNKSKIDNLVKAPAALEVMASNYSNLEMEAILSAIATLTTGIIESFKTRTSKCPIYKTVSTFSICGVTALK